MFSRTIDELRFTAQANSKLINHVIILTALVEERDIIFWETAYLG